MELEKTQNLYRILKRSLGQDVLIRLNNNRSTMLRVLERNEEMIRISVHRMFLEAPEEVIESMAYFFSGSKKMPVILKKYIQEKSDLLKKPSSSQSITQGEYYDLSRAYLEVKEAHFSADLDLKITWYGQKPTRSRRHATLGLFDSTQNLIKIHRVLDHPQVPYYYLKFVIYHEILHFISPPYVDERGVLRMHHKAFKEKEQLFENYSQALQWERKNKKIWFSKEI